MVALAITYTNSLLFSSDVTCIGGSIVILNDVFLQVHVPADGQGRGLCAK